MTATDGIARLLALDTAALDRLRAAYWARVAAAGADVAGKVFVDMDPLKGLKLPVIALLFPATRIVVMHRDPRELSLVAFATASPSAPPPSLSPTLARPPTTTPR